MTGHSTSLFSKYLRERDRGRDLKIGDHNPKVVGKWKTWFGAFEDN